LDRQIADPAERRRLRRRWLLAGIPVAALLVVLSAKAFDAGGDTCDDPSPAPPAETALLPAGLSFDGIGTVTSVGRDERNVMVRAVTTRPLDEAPVLVQDAVIAAGYRPAGIESEGVEAIVFFTTRSNVAAGQARLRQTPCAGRSDIDLVLLDR
jgi:hypothetical protein